jgi:hypothetical protein
MCYFKDLFPYLRSTIINVKLTHYQLRHVGVFSVRYSYSLTILIKFKQGNLCCISKSMMKHQQNTGLKFGSPFIWLWLLKCICHWFFYWISTFPSQLCWLLGLAWLLKFKHLVQYLINNVMLAFVLKSNLTIIPQCHTPLK